MKQDFNEELKKVTEWQKANQLNREDFESDKPEQVGNGKCPICKVNPLNGKPECLSCWVKGKDNDKNDRIANAQAFNLAQAVCGMIPLYPDEKASEDYRNRLLAWQKYFYEKLTQRNET